MANENAALVAAKWWTNAIANPSPESFNNGDRTSDASFMYMMLGHMRAMNHLASRAQLENFCSILTKKIEKELKKHPSVVLSCDYDPCNLLAQCAEKAEIDSCLFPFKRSMKITEKKVEVKDGYSARWVLVFPEK